MQPVSFFSTRQFPVQQSPRINHTTAANSSFGSVASVGIQHRTTDSFQRFSGIPEAKELLKTADPFTLPLRFVWTQSSARTQASFADGGKQLTDKAIAAMLVVKELLDHGLTDKKMNALYERSIDHQAVAHMLKKKLTSHEMMALLDKALEDEATANHLARAGSLNAQQLRSLLHSKPALIKRDIQREFSPHPDKVLDSIEIPSPVQAIASDATNSAIQSKDPRGLPNYQPQIDGQDGLALPEAELKKMPVEDRIAFARFEFDRKNKLIKDLVRRKGKDKIAAARWDVSPDKIK